MGQLIIMESRRRQKPLLKSKSRLGWLDRFIAEYNKEHKNKFIKSNG